MGLRNILLKAMTKKPECFERYPPFLFSFFFLFNQHNSEYVINHWTCLHTTTKRSSMQRREKNRGPTQPGSDVEYFSALRIKIKTA